MAWETLGQYKKALYYSRNTGKTNGRNQIIKLKLTSEAVADQILMVYKKVLKY